MFGLKTAVAPVAAPSTARSKDRAAALPEEARRRLGWLAQRAEELADAAEGAHGASEQANNRFRDARALVETMKERKADEEAGSKKATPATLASLSDAEAALVRARRSHERAMQHSRDTIVELQGVRDMQTALQRYIGGNPAGTLVDNRPDLKLGAAGGYAALVAKYRGEALRLEAERREVQLAPMTAEEVKRKARAEVEELAERGAPFVSGAAEPFIDHGDGRIQAPRIGIGWPTKRMTGLEPSATGSGHTPSVVDTAALVAWLHKDRLIEALEADIDEAYATTDGIDTHERGKRIRALSRQIAQAERLEAEAIWKGVEAGEAVEWRALPAAAVLGVKVDAALAQQQQPKVSGAGLQEVTGR
ncbi:MAG: hypothetical protein ACK4F5_14955 [Aliihoeflea sp.]